MDRIDDEPMELEWNIFTGFNTLQLSQEVKELLLRLNETPENFTGRIIFMSMFNDISWRSRDNKVDCESNVNLVSLFARRFGAGQWLFLGLGSEKKWYSISEDSVKSTSPITEMATKNGYENCIYSMNNIHMSNEDNKHDINYINKHKCTNIDTRKLHL